MRVGVLNAASIVPAFGGARPSYCLLPLNMSRTYSVLTV